MFDESSSTVVDTERVAALRRELDDLFVVNGTSLDRPEPGYVQFRGHFYAEEIHEVYDELRLRFERHGFTPLVRPDESVNMSDGRQVALIGLPHVFESPRPRWGINLALFLATIGTTLLAGAGMALSMEPNAELTPLFLLRGWPFSLCVLLILGAHELGHYFAARYHHAPASLPYFIPFPSLFFGTMGAVILLREPLKNRRALFDMGAAGPLAGLVFAIPILLLGLSMAEVQQFTGGGIQEGNSILYFLAKYAVFGQALPQNGYDVLANQVSWAGWIGLFVTGLNLIPLGQLDGGHIAYVLFGPRARSLFLPVIFFLGALALLFEPARFQWLIWIVLLFFLGRRHAVPLDDVTELDPRRRTLAIMTLVIFFLVFVPIPLSEIIP